MKVEINDTTLSSLEHLDLTGVTELNCSRNRLTSLPKLPPTLKKLICVKNRLASLPELPSSLIVLYCTFNDLISLPTLPPNLKMLSCDHNRLKSFPVLPSSLEYLWCSNDDDKSILPDLSLKLQGSVYNYFETIYLAKLYQHNEKRIKLGIPIIYSLPKKEEWDDINNRYTVFRYEPGGDMFEQAQQNIQKLLSEN